MYITVGKCRSWTEQSRTNQDRIEKERQERDKHTVRIGDDELRLEDSALADLIHGRDVHAVRSLRLERPDQHCVLPVRGCKHLRADMPRRADRRCSVRVQYK